MFEQNELIGRILFAMKANKSDAFVEMMSKTETGVDASSLQELRKALAHGIQGKDIGISGPQKDPRLLLLAIQHNCMVSLDSAEELQVLVSILENFPRARVRILIRLNDVSEKASRFGIPSGELPEIYKILQKHHNQLCFEGFSFHINDYSTENRAKAIIKVIKLIHEARGLGFDCKTIDAGGGFTINYLDQQDWEIFKLGQNDEARFFGGKKFPGFYPYHSQKTKGDFLSDILSVSSEHGSIAQQLNKGNIELAIEPGRALLDQAGVTVMRVNGVKKVANGEMVVTVSANINSLSEQILQTDFLVDPIHIPRNIRNEEGEFEAAVGGNTCLEADMVSWHRVGFKSRPQQGDLLVYVNTAGYQMDSNETEFHGLPIPIKVATFKKDQQWKWKQDNQFSLLDLINSK